jgi:hypothetical protein
MRFIFGLILTATLFVGSAHAATLQINGDKAQDLIAALKASGVAMLNNNTVLQTPAVECDNNDNNGAGEEATDPNAGLDDIGTCYFYKIAADGSTVHTRELSQPHWVLTALANAGIEADVAMGGWYGYEANSITCTIHLDQTVYDAARFDCVIQTQN